MAKIFKVNRGFILDKAFDCFLDGESYKQGTELLVKNENGKEFIFDGCFRLGESNDNDILKFGEIIETSCANRKDDSSIVYNRK